MPDYTGCRKWFTEYRNDRDELVEDDTDPLIARVTLRFANAASDRLGTITVEWYSHEGHYKVPEDPVPVLTIPWNAWGALPHCGDLLERLGRATGPAMQSGAFCELLRQSGFEDRT